MEDSWSVCKIMYVDSDYQPGCISMSTSEIKSGTVATEHVDSHHFQDMRTNYIL